MFQKDIHRHVVVGSTNFIYGTRFRFKKKKEEMIYVIDNVFFMVD